MAIRMQRPRAKTAANGTVPPHVNPEDVAKVAYELFLQRGGKHGNDQEDWFRAEQIVRERQRRYDR